MQRQAKKRSGDAGGAGGTKRAVTPRSAFIVLACTAIAEYFAFICVLRMRAQKREFHTAGM